MKSISLALLFLLALQLFLSGCIQNYNDLTSTQCTDDLGAIGKSMCIKYKAAYLAAFGETALAVQECEKLRPSLVPSVRNLKQMVAGEHYRDCILRVAEISGDPSVCSNLHSSRLLTYFEYIRRSVAPSFSSPIRDECLRRAQLSERQGEKLLESFELLGFSRPSP